MESLLNLSPLYTFVSENAISESDISAKNLVLSNELIKVELPP